MLILSAEILKKLLKYHHISVKQVGYGSGPTLVGPDLGPNCLQRLSAGNTSLHFQMGELQLAALCFLKFSLSLSLSLQLWGDSSI